jgi:hypothetical protein
MKRIDVLLGMEPQPPCDYPEDVERLKQGIPQLNLLSDLEIQAVYREYSEETHCAGWLILNDAGVEAFNNWLQEEA